MSDSVPERVWLVDYVVEFEPGHRIGVYGTREAAIAAGNTAARELGCAAYHEADGDLVWIGVNDSVVATLEEVL